MTLIPVQLPFKGFTEQSQYSAIPEGMTPSCLNMMPVDPWNGRTRISTRQGTQVYSLGDVQFMGSYRVYEGTNLVEKIIFVRAGKVWFSDPHSDLPATPVLFGSGVIGSSHTQDTPFLNTTGLVEGVQFNDHFYFVDGTHYVFVHLTDPSSATAVQRWGEASSHGPFHTDPASPTGNRATLICRWGARLVLAGYKSIPNVWFACAPDAPYPSTNATGTGAPVDGWTGNDVIGAVSGGSTPDFGTLGDPIVAIFPFAQSGLMFACSNSFTFLTTDPVFEEAANMVSLTKSIGIAGSRAWCQSQEKGAFILAKDGLYFLNANDFNFNRANRISAGRLDSFFLRLDFGTPAIGGSSEIAGGTLRSIQTSGGSGTGATATTIDSSGAVSSSPTDSPIAVAENVAAFTGDTNTGDVFPCLCYDPDREGVWIFLSVKGNESASLHVYYDIKTDSFWPQRFSDTNMLAPISGSYIGVSRSNSGRLFLGGGNSISIIDKAFPLGIDGYNSEGMTEAQQQQKFVRSSLTVGPIIAPLPYRIMMNEVRVDLSEDDYELPFQSFSVGPLVSVSTGETAQAALGLRSDSIFVINLNEIVIDGGSASVSPTTPNYNGGTVANDQSNTIDGRLSCRPFGQYTQNDQFSSGNNRVYNGPFYWVMRWDTNASPDGWCIEREVTSGNFDIEYSSIADENNPNGSMTTAWQNPLSPDVKDNAVVSGASFDTATVNEIGELNSGRNMALKCRIRAEAMYITIASDGRPWAIERMSIQAAQVGKSRGVT